MAPARDIGIGVPLPARECADAWCPFHGTLPVRGVVLEGTVASDNMARTVVIQREYLRFVRKFERYERRRTRMAAHNPPCIGARAGDRVVVAECRPLSKTKKFVVVRKLGEPAAPAAPAAAPVPAPPPTPAPPQPAKALEPPGEEPEEVGEEPEKRSKKTKAKEPRKTKEAKPKTSKGKKK